jgi:hypothetical protein
MTPIKKLWTGLALASVSVLALPVASLRADDVPQFSKKDDFEKKFVSRVAVAIVKAAHSTAKDPSLEEYKFKEVKPGRTRLEIRATFKGAITRKEYTTNIVVHIDSLDKKAWEVLRIDYSDNDRVPYNSKRIEALIKAFNRK